MRPLYAYLRALTLPTSVPRSLVPQPWGSAYTRIEGAATELAVMVRAGVEQHVADDGWSSYQHQFAGNATRAAADLDFESPLMRLAAGGRPAPPQRDAA
jgi:FMN reductase